MFILEAAPIIYQPTTFAKDYAQMKQAGSGTFSFGEHEYKITIGSSKYIEVSWNDQKGTSFKLAFKNRRDLKKLLKNLELPQNKDFLDQAFSNLGLLKSIQLEIPLSPENSQSDEEKEEIRKTIASYEDAAKELSKLVNSQECPSFLKDRIFEGMADIYNHLFQKIHTDFRDTNNGLKIYQRNNSKDAHDEQSSSLNETTPNLVIERLLYIIQIYNNVKSLQEIMRKFSPESPDNETQFYSQYRAPKCLFENEVNKINENVKNIDVLLEAWREII